MTRLETLPQPDHLALSTESGAAIWWLGQAGFLVAMGGLRIVIDPYLSDSLAEKYRGTTFPHHRMMPPPVEPGALTGIDWVLATHGHSDHLDPGTLPPLLAANPSARVVVPRAEREKAVARGVPEDRIVAIDIGEAMDLGGVILTATPAAHEDLSRSETGYLYLGYALSDGGVTLWHSGDCIPYPGLVDWLRPLQVDVALLPINGRDDLRAAHGVPGNFTVSEAIDLAEAIGSGVMIGHHFGMFDFNTADPSEAARTMAERSSPVDLRLARTHVEWRISPEPKKALSVLCVCRGNICRSPTAHGLLARLLPGHRVDGAATMDWNVGRPPEATTLAVALDRGLDLSDLRARQIDTGDHTRFDLIYAVDRSVMDHLAKGRTGGAPLGQLGYLADPERDPDIADPWGHERAAFERTYDILERACRRLATLIAAGQGRLCHTREEDHGSRGKR